MMNKEVLAPKLMVLGVDGMDPRLCKKYISEGKMPNLQKIYERGAKREDMVLLGAQPTVTPPQWTTLAVGAYPSTHGITQLQRCIPGLISQQGYNIDSRLCKAEPAWNCLAEAGRKTLVFHWPGSAWPPTSDSENLYVVDGSTPGAVATFHKQVDDEILVAANINITEVTIQKADSDGGVAPCVIKNDEQASKNEGVGREACYQIMERTDDVMKQLQDDGIETMPVHTKDTDGFGTRGGAVPMPPVWTLSPINVANGWTMSVPEGAKEFTILFSGGLVRRIGLILKNDNGIYDRVAIYKSKKEVEPIVECPVGKMIYNVIDEVIYADTTHVSNRHYKLIDLKEDGTELRMYVSAAMEMEKDNVFKPKRLMKALLDNAGPFPPQAFMYVEDEDLQLINIEVWDYVVDWYIKSLHYMIEEEGIEYIFSHLHSVDIVEHTFIRYMHNLGYNKYPEEVSIGWMERLYKQTDRYLGAFIHYLDEGWSIIVTSDHAQVAAKHIPPFIGDNSGINAGLMKDLGYTVLKKDENGNELKKVDWSKTRAIAAQGNDIFINLKGREAHGIVDPEDQYELEEQIMTDLYGYKHPDTGKRVIALALRNREAILLGYGGPTAGDICFWTAEGYNYDHCDGLSTTYGEGSTSLSPIFVAAGPGFKESYLTDRVIRQVDVAPTICYLAGVRMPAQCEGAPVYQIIDDEI